MPLSDKTTLRQLRYFIAVAEERSISAAADRLNISQPPLSRQLRDLELSVKCSLISRSSKGVILTAEGEEFYVRAKDILKRLDEAHEEAVGISAGVKGTLSIGYTGDFEYGRFPECLSRFRTENPRVYLKVILGFSGQLAEMVERGDLDAALVSPPLGPHLKELSIATVDKVPLFALVAKDHRFSKRRQLSLIDLEKENFILGRLTYESGYHIKLLELFRAANISPNIDMEVFPTSMIANLVSKGHGVSLVVSDNLDPSRSDVAKIKLKEDNALLERAIIWRRSFSTLAVSRFYETLIGTPLDAKMK
ncbi:MAG: LysR family transcriptional regulator [Pseudomonadota bacterium]